MPGGPQSGTRALLPASPGQPRTDRGWGPLQQSKTLRFKLTAYYVAIFGALQVGLWVLVQGLVASHLRQRFDTELLQRAQGIGEAIELDSRDHGSLRLAERLKGVIAPFESQNTFIQIRLSASGDSVRSANLRGFDFPFAVVSEDTERAPEWRDLRGAIPDALSGKGHQLRLVNICLVEHRPPIYLQVAASLAPLERTLTVMQQLLIVFIVVSVLTAAIVSWLLAGRSLAPIGLITRHARRLSAAQLDQRIPAAAREDEVAEMVSAINDMLARFENQFKNQQQFISNVGHELKTPLAVLLVELQTRRARAAADPELDAFFDIAEDEVRRLLRTVEAFLILARARARRRLETTAEVSIEDVLIAGTQHGVRYADARNVRIVPKFAVDEQLSEPVVPGDADMLTTLIENLIVNAVRHSPPDEAVEVEAVSTPKQVQLFVRDRGPGIPEEHRKRVFELFYQVESPAGESGKAGIGLALVKAIAELHGGTVSVRNREGGGCEFCVTLPTVARP